MTALILPRQEKKRWQRHTLTGILHVELEQEVSSGHSNSLPSYNDSSKSHFTTIMEDTDDDSLEGSNIEENETSQSSKSGDDYSQGPDSGEEHEDDRASEAHGHYNMDALKDSLNEMSTKYDNLAKSFDDMGKDVNDIKGRDVNAFGAKLKEYHKTTAAENQVLNERLDRMKEKHDNFVISTAELTITDTNLLNLING